MIERLKDIKEHVGTITAIFGVVTVLLYIFGFTSLMFHWIMIGFGDISGDPLTYLLNGGKICVLALYNFAFSFLDMIINFDARFVPVLICILVMSIAFFHKSVPERVRRHLLPYDLLWIAFGLFLTAVIMLCIMDMYELVEFNILFGESVLLSEERPSIFIDYYIYILGWWTVFLFICRAIGKRSPIKNQNSEQDKTSKIAESKESIPWTQKYFPILKKLSATAVIIMSLYYPIFINIYSSHSQFHMVQLVLKKDSNNFLDHISNVGEIFGLLYETDENYALYKRFPRPFVLKIDKANVSAILIYPKADIRKPESYKLSRKNKGS